MWCHAGEERRNPRLIRGAATNSDFLARMGRILVLDSAGERIQEVTCTG